MQAFRDAQVILRELGAVLHPVAPPFDFADLTARSSRIIAAEAYAIHREALSKAESPYAPAIRARMEAGKGAIVAEYLDQLATRRVFMAAYKYFMQDYEAFLAPAVPMPAIPWPMSTKSQTPLAALPGRATTAAPAGWPCRPAGAARDSPVAIQLLGRPFGESDILALGVAYEEVVAFNRRRPDIESWA